MNLRHYTIIGSISVLAAGGALFLASSRADAQEQGVEELTRGPVHEAFAASVSYDPQPGIIVKTAPPALIEEVPPDQRPEGDNITWIPGYWGWDNDQNDFIWISGIWRNLPPSRQWVPGYWADLSGQWQWTSGYWADQEAKEVSYLPQPPKSIETGPNVAAPSVDDIWISGTWIQRDDRYAWRPGYWDLGRANWIWIPAHYQWTYRGYLFIEGYWDYNVDRRGVLFAPVHFRHDYYNRAGYFYTPMMVISLNVFMNHLFVRPGYGHYYFGDYYSPRYRNEGYYASYSYESGRHGYDPIFSYNRWEHRHESGWEHGRRDDFAFYRDHKDARPPGTWAAMLALPEGKRGGRRDHFSMAQPLKSYAMGHDGGPRFQTLSKDSHDQIVAQNHEIRKFGQERLRAESRPVDKSATGPGKPGFATHETLTKSPVLGKRADQFTGADAPPKLHMPHNPNINDGKSPADIGKHTAIPEKTDIPSGTGHGDLIQPGKKGHGTDAGKNVVIPEKTPRIERKTVDPTPRVERQPVEPRIERKTVDPTPRIERRPVEPRIERKTVDPTPRVERQPVEPRIERKTVDPTPRVERRPVEPRIERKTVDPTPRIERRPVEPRIERKTVDPAPRVERQPVQPAPRVERQPVQPTPRVERQPVQPAPRVVAPAPVQPRETAPGNHKKKDNEPGTDDKSRGR
jgi:hypothetical protein